MDYFLIFALGIAVFAVWRSGADAVERLRDELARLEREIGWLRAQLEAHRKVHAAEAAQPAGQTAAQGSNPPEAAKPPAAAVTQPAGVVGFKPITRPGGAIPEARSAPATAPAPVPAAAPAPAGLPVAPLPAREARPLVGTPAAAIPAAAVAAQRDEEDGDSAAVAAGAGGIFSLEERLGRNWLNKLGIASVVLGLAYFLAYRFQTWGPGGKVLCGFLVSAVMLGGGVWLERKPTYRIIARAAIGGGWALAYFTTFAMHHVAAARVLPSLGVDLALMMVVAAGMVAHSLRYRSQTVTGLAFLLGFATLLTSDLEAGDGSVVFSLTASALLAVALVVVTTLRHWTVLELAGLAAVYLNHLVWLNQVMPREGREFAEFWPSTALILLYWAIFRVAYVLRTPLDQTEENRSSLAAVLNSGGVLGLLKVQSAHPEWAFWALLGLGAAEMGLAFWVRARRRQAFHVLATIATVLLVTAVPFRFHGVSWPVLWLAEAQVLALCGLRMGEPVFRRLGLLAGVATGIVLAFHDLLPLALLRLDYPDPGGHTELTVALALAAALYWVHGEVYPRRWPQIAEDKREALALRVTSWLGLGAACAALWVALPEMWVPVGWLALVLLLGWAAHRFRGALLAMESDLLALASGAVLIFHQVWPLAVMRLTTPDVSRHWAQTAVLGLAAAAYWVHTEIYPRVLEPIQARPEDEPWWDFESADLDLAVREELVLPGISWLGVVMGAAALWVALPAAWMAAGWLGLVLLLGLAADRWRVERLALQADLLAVTALIGLFAWRLGTTGSGWWDHKAPLLAAVALLYAGMRRKTVLAGSRNYVAPAYSWAATVLLALVAADLSTDLALTPVWVALGVGIFEIGRFSRKGFLRWQGFFLAALGFARFLGYDLWASFLGRASDGAPAWHGGRFSLVNSLLLEVLILSAVGYLLLERTRNADRCARREHIAGTAADALGTLSIALWFAYRFPSDWVPVENGAAWVTAIWAGMAAVLLGLAWLMRRMAFQAQALALVLAVVARGLFVDLFAEDAAGFWQGPLFHLGVTAAILLAALPFAFRLRGGAFWQGATIVLPGGLGPLLRRPEQVFFFAAFGLEAVALAVKLSSGHITIAWSLLGLGTFLFALVVGERAYRLAGLGLLLVSVAKIVLMDVWKLSRPDRIVTLIVLGLALLAVSFLYTRFGTVMRRYL